MPHGTRKNDAFHNQPVSDLHGANQRRGCSDTIDEDPPTE